MFNKVPENKELPDDIYLVKEIKDKDNRAHYAPSILLHDGDRGGADKGELEEIIASREGHIEGKDMVDIVVRNNSYMPVRSRKMRIYYVSKEKAGDGSHWQLLKTPLGQDYTETEMVLPGQDGLGRESFLLPAEKEEPYYLIAALDEEFGETAVGQGQIDLSQINESYYWCVLDSEEMAE